MSAQDALDDWLYDPDVMKHDRMGARDSEPVAEAAAVFRRIEYLTRGPKSGNRYGGGYKRRIKAGQRVLGAEDFAGDAEEERFRDLNAGDDGDDW